MAVKLRLRCVARLRPLGVVWAAATERLPMQDDGSRCLPVTCSSMTHAVHVIMNVYYTHPFNTG